MGCGEEWRARHGQSLAVLFSTQFIACLWVWPRGACQTIQTSDQFLKLRVLFQRRWPRHGKFVQDLRLTAQPLVDPGASQVVLSFLPHARRSEPAGFDFPRQKPLAAFRIRRGLRQAQPGRLARGRLNPRRHACHPRDRGADEEPRSTSSSPARISRRMTFERVSKSFAASSSILSRSTAGRRSAHRSP
jgi:hypothetical protein